MPINPYLNFAGNAREAVEYYHRVFETAKPVIQTFGEMPGDPTHPMPDDAKNLVMHARINIAGTDVMFSDVFPGMGIEFKPGNNVSLAVVSTNRDDIVNWFNKLKQGGKVYMDLQETFWSKAYGNLQDKFGTEWQLSLDSGETFP